MRHAGWNLPYEQGLFGLEITFMILFAVVELPRLQLGSSGNKAEKLTHIFLMVALSTAVLLYFIYYTTLQTFVYGSGAYFSEHSAVTLETCLETLRVFCRLRIEQILGGLAMAVVILQMCLAIIPAVRILRLPS